MTDDDELPHLLAAARRQNRDLTETLARLRACDDPRAWNVALGVERSIALSEWAMEAARQAAGVAQERNPT